MLLSIKFSVFYKAKYTLITHKKTDIEHFLKMFNALKQIWTKNELNNIVTQYIHCSQYKNWISKLFNKYNILIYVNFDL